MSRLQEFEIGEIRDKFGVFVVYGPDFEYPDFGEVFENPSEINLHGVIDVPGWSIFVAPQFRAIRCVEPVV